MLITDPKNINFKHCKRLFTIGCSFTHWIWPTWADIIAKEHDIEHFNFGMPGQGNDYVLQMLSQVTREYALKDTDVVLIMFSTFHRNTFYNYYGAQFKDYLRAGNSKKVEEDRSAYNWVSGSDLVAQIALDDKTTNCDRGWLIRNYAIIDSITTIMQNSVYKGGYMLSVDPKEQHIFDTTATETYTDDVHGLYHPLRRSQLGKPLYTFLDHKLNDHVWKSVSKNMEKADYHPYPSNYLAYLKSIGFDISESTEKWVAFSERIINETENPYTLDQSKEWPFSYYPKRRLPL